MLELFIFNDEPRREMRDQLTRAQDPDPAPGPQNMGIFSDRYIFLGLFCQIFYQVLCVTSRPSSAWILGRNCGVEIKSFVCFKIFDSPRSTHIKFIEAKTLSSAKT